jgi:hypothetical protein
VQITTDGHRAYVEAIEGAFGMEVDYAMLIKLYGSPATPETRYSPVNASELKLKSSPAILTPSTFPRRM